MHTREIERMLKEDIREKKKIGSGAFHMRGKGVKHGFSGALRTPYHYMSNKEKKKLNGEVETYFMYETIIPINEFELKDAETQKNMLTRWREIYDNLHIRTEMGISNKAFYDLVADLKIPKKTRVDSEEKKRKGTTKQAKKKEAPKKTLLDFVEEETTKEEIKKEIKEEINVVSEISPTPVLVTNGINFNYNKIADQEELNRILTKCQLIVDGEPNKFQLTLTLTEIVKG
jgi:hypothetical protein